LIDKLISDSSEEENFKKMGQEWGSFSFKGKRD
jgi:hypothetical protein